MIQLYNLDGISNENLDTLALWYRIDNMGDIATWLADPEIAKKIQEEKEEFVKIDDKVNIDIKQYLQPMLHTFYENIRKLSFEKTIRFTTYTKKSSDYIIESIS